MDEERISQCVKNIQSVTNNNNNGNNNNNDKRCNSNISFTR